jgi:hypothetical protein
MTQDEIAGRLVALEVVSLTALVGTHLANTPKDADRSMAAAALANHIRKMVAKEAASLPPDIQVAARHYTDQLTLTLAKNLAPSRDEDESSRH